MLHMLHVRDPLIQNQTKKNDKNYWEAYENKMSKMKN